MRLSDQEKYAIRLLIRRDPLAAETLWYTVRGGLTAFDGVTTQAQWDRAIHLEDVKKRLQRWHLCRRIRDRNAATQRAEAHGYRPEFV